MIEYVLVTVRYLDKMQKDLELPAKIDIQVLSKMLLETLQTIEPNWFLEKEQLKLSCAGRIIEQGTLWENKIWDGKILEIIV